MSSVTPQTVFVGLDYHAESVQVCVLDRDQKQLANRSCPNDWRAVESGGADDVRRAGQRAGGDRSVLRSSRPGGRADRPGAVVGELGASGLRRADQAEPGQDGL